MVIASFWLVMDLRGQVAHHRAVKEPNDLGKEQCSGYAAWLKFQLKNFCLTEG